MSIDRKKKYTFPSRDYIIINLAFIKLLNDTRHNLLNSYYFNQTDKKKKKRIK